MLTERGGRTVDSTPQECDTYSPLERAKRSARAASVKSRNPLSSLYFELGVPDKLLTPYRDRAWGFKSPSGHVNPHQPSITLRDEPKSEFLGSRRCCGTRLAAPGPTFPGRLTEIVERPGGSPSACASASRTPPRSRMMLSRVQTTVIFPLRSAAASAAGARAAGSSPTR